MLVPLVLAAWSICFYIFSEIFRFYLKCEPESGPPHIRLQVVKIFISRAIPQDMLAVVFEATV